MLFFYDKVIFCRRYNKAGGIIILLLFLSENIRSMKKILNNLLHRLKEDSLNKRVGNSTREVEYKEKREIKTCLVFWSADTDQNKWFRKLESDFAGVKMDKLCFIPDGIEMLETDDLVAVRNADLGFGGKIRNGRLIAMLGCNQICITTYSGFLYCRDEKGGRSGRYCDRRSDRTFRPCK